MLHSSLEDQLRYWHLLEPLTLEYNYLSKMDIITNAFKGDYQKLVKKYNEKSERTISTISDEYLRKESNLINNNISLLKNAIELGRTSAEVSDNVFPILLHYSWHCLMSFLIYSLCYWDDTHALGHGLHTSLKDDPTKITLVIRNKGIFRRCIDVFSLLGYPLVFSPWISVIKNSKMEFIQNPNPLQNVGNQININNLLTFDYSKWIKTLNLKEEEIVCSDLLNSGNGSSVNNCLISYAIVFLASNIARYRPAVWNEILLGKNAFNANFIKKYKWAINYYANGRGEDGFILNINDIFSQLEYLKFYIRRDNTRTETKSLY